MSSIDYDATHVGDLEVNQAVESVEQPVPPSPTTWAQEYPVLLLGLTIVLPGAAAAVAALADGETLLAAVLAGLSTVVAYATRWVAEQVTPVRNPKLADGVPLRVPDDEGEDV